jgi:hypothetical protein
MRKEIITKVIRFLAWLSLSGLLAACAVVTTAGDIAQGWDPDGTIRAGIKAISDMISSGKIDWSQLIADGESLGIGIEQEEDDFRVQVLRS